MQPVDKILWKSYGPEESDGDLAVKGRTVGHPVEAISQPA